MPDVSVIVPWRPGCPHREAAWAWVSRRYAALCPDWQVVEARCPPGPWVKAAAVADGLTRADGTILVVADADCWAPAITAAVAEPAPWSVPHSQVHRLTPDATVAVLGGAGLGGPTVEPPYTGHAGGGITVLPRDLYLEVPLDPRFEGWGGEDDSWGVALTTIAGAPARNSGPLWHLWHPAQPRQSRSVGTTANHRLYRRYANARRRPAVMRALLDELQDESWPT